MCPTLNLPKSSTITGSPSASQQSVVERPNGDEVTQVLCNDGAYRDTYDECIRVAQEVIDQKNAVIIEKYKAKVKELEAAGWSAADIEKYYPDPVKATTPPVVDPEDPEGGDDDQEGGDDDVTPVPPTPINPNYNENYEFALLTPSGYCSDGTPIYNGASPRVVCGIIPACPTGTTRCLDGTCSASKCDGITWDTLPEDKINCTSTFGLELCVDGSCNLIGECPQYNGCAIGYYQCANRECVLNANQCTAAANRKADDFAKQLLNDAKKNDKKKNAQNLDEIIFVNLGEMLDQVDQQQTIDDISISLTDDINNLPYNSMIQQFHDELKKYVPRRQMQHPMFVTTAQTTTPTTVDGKNKYYKACSPDLSTCMSTQQIAKTSILYDATQSEATYTIGPLATAFTVKLSSGLSVDQTKDTSIYFSPVGESVYYNATNRVTYSRVGEFGEALTAVQTVLSPVMTCTAGSGIIEPFTVPIEVSSLVDRTVMTPTIAPQDICLARLRRYPQFNYAVWECLYTDEQRKSGQLQYSVRQSDTQPLKQAISSITTCADSDVIGSSAIYAFIHQPVSTKQVYKMSLDTFLKDNIIGLCLLLSVLRSE
eukprot:UN02571